MTLINLKKIQSSQKMLKRCQAIVTDTILAYECTLYKNRYISWVVATRQASSTGKPKSPRIQVVLPEDLCTQLTDLAQQESRTVSNMAKVLIQEGVKKYDRNFLVNTEKFRSALEEQPTSRLKGAPRRFKLYRPN